MLEISDYIILFLLGSVGAFIAGLLGVGGGIIFIPILDYFLYKLGLRDDALVKGILANSLFVIIFSGAIASYKQYRINNFFPKEILWTALPGAITALLMTYLIKSGDWYSKTTFNYFFAAMLLLILLRMFLARSNKHNEQESAKPLQYSLTGLFAGIVTAFSGLGGGVVMTPVFTDAMKIDIRKASSISNGVIPIFAICIGIYNISANAPVIIPSGQLGYILLPLVAPMILSSFVFAPLGVKYSQRINARFIRMIFAIFVTLVFLKLMYELFA